MHWTGRRQIPTKVDSEVDLTSLLNTVFSPLFFLSSCCFFLGCCSLTGLPLLAGTASLEGTPSQSTASIHNICFALQLDLYHNMTTLCFSQQTNTKTFESRFDFFSFLAQPKIFQPLDKLVSQFLVSCHSIIHLFIYFTNKDILYWSGGKKHFHPLTISSQQESKHIWQNCL